jgi:hypothetical protein
VIALKKIKRHFKDVTRGDPWAAPLTKQNLNRTQNHEVIALKKIKRTFLRTFQGGGLGLVLL